MQRCQDCTRPSDTQTNGKAMSMTGREDKIRAINWPQRKQWRLARHILFHFEFCYIVLYFVPLLLVAIPGTGWLSSCYSWLGKLVDGLIFVHILKLDPLQASMHPGGSGDTALAYFEQALKLIFAVTGSILWTALDFNSPNHFRLEIWMRVLARYALAFALFSYAIVKIIPTQFPPLGVMQLTETYGASSPMRLLWNFMGFSSPYTIFAGCMELLPACLLIFRRTTLLGSLLGFAVLLNIVMLNFCYDVPVKLYSLNLLLLSIILILPDSRRLMTFFLMNSPPPSNPSEPYFRTVLLRRTAILLKFVILAVFLSNTVSSAIARYRVLASQPAPPHYPLTSRGFNWVQENPYNK